MVGVPEALIKDARILAAIHRPGVELTERVARFEERFGY